MIEYLARAIADENPDVLIATLGHVTKVCEVSSHVAWSWPTAWDELSKHRAHLVISTVGGDSPKHRAVVLQRLLSAILSASPSAIDVNYVSSGTLLPAKLAFPI
ncbi:hypothetical protein [Rhizobium sp. FY34]|uniref:hypothetical protein n=1 Tax=Rhizobium sp. FY34 TaxID=2562309 RepID=UPI0010C082B3|nr:hypothetical protein [Rhizobium sp. FY34]